MQRGDVDDLVSFLAISMLMLTVDRGYLQRPKGQPLMDAPNQEFTFAGVLKS